MRLVVQLVQYFRLLLQDLVVQWVQQVQQGRCHLEGHHLLVHLVGLVVLQVQLLPLIQ